jgi:hypothetical protein
MMARLCGSPRRRCSARTTPSSHLCALQPDEMMPPRRYRTTRLLGNDDRATARDGADPTARCRP